LDDVGVQPALEALAERTAATSRLQIELDIDLAYEREDEPTRLIPEIENAIYRSVQETLTNVAKHALTDRASVSMREGGGTVRIEVRDEGVGFDPDAVSGGFGLIGMRERAELVDGKLTVSSEPGAGTTVSLVVPAVHVPASLEVPSSPLSSA
jgi:signal transduction histidine kinase